MIDTLNITIDRGKLKKKITNRELKARLDLFDEGRTTKNGQKHFSGHLRNYNVKVTDSKIWLNGSLCKFYHGNNLDYLSCMKIPLALKELGKELGIPIGNGIIRRVDWGINCEVSKNTEEYFECLLDTPKFIRNRNFSEVKYHKHRLTLAFYDKVKELKKNDPASFLKVGNKEIIRIELRLEKKINEFLGFKPLVAHLCMPNTQIRLRQLFCENYNLILKRKMVTPIKPIAGIPDLKKIFLYYGIEVFGGEYEAYQVLNRIKIQSEWTYNKVRRGREVFKEVYNRNPILKEMDIMKELDNEVFSRIEKT